MTLDRSRSSHNPALTAQNSTAQRAPSTCHMPSDTSDTLFRQPAPAPARRKSVSPLRLPARKHANTDTTPKANAEFHRGRPSKDDLQLDGERTAFETAERRRKKQVEGEALFGARGILRGVGGWRD